MRHDQCRTNGIQAKRTRHRGAVDGFPAFLRRLVLVVEKAGRIDNQIQLTLCRREIRGSLDCILLYQIYRRLAGPAESDYALKAWVCAYSALVCFIWSDLNTLFKSNSQLEARTLRFDTKAQV